MKQEIRDYLTDILNECRYLLERIKEFDYSSFLKNEDLKKAFARSLEVIGEAVKKIPSEVRNQYPGLTDRMLVACEIN